MEFRKDINGLRAFAVMAVVFYHFALGGFHGGYAGVDIFFVISGFLMTGIILSRLWQGKFSLLDFYIGRARRIIPALAVLSAVLLAAGYFWLIPSDYKTLGEHTAAAITFVSNFVFKGEEGYFDAPMRDKWLLHTWSLSVEWQFYLLYPLFLMGVQKYLKSDRNKLMLILLGLALVSLAGSILATPLKSSFSFYLLPTRIWEFMAGALVYVLLQDAKSPFRGSAATAFLGIALLTASFFIFNDETGWPGFAALLPVLGSALVILAAHEKSFLTGNAAAQWIGKTSYSIYLWHWPVFVGLGYFGKTGNGWAAAGIAASLLLGYISYAFVEAPTRRKTAGWMHLSAVTVTAAVVAMAGYTGYSVYNADGLPDRVSCQIRAIDDMAGNADKATPECGFDKRTKTLKRCYSGGENNIKFAVWGDSHAGALAGAVAAAAQGNGITYVFSCPTIFNARIKTKEENQGCEAFNSLVFSDVKTLPESVPVIVINRFSYYLHGATEAAGRPFGLHYADVPEDEAKKDPAGIFKKKLTKSLCDIAAARKLYVVWPIAEMGVDVPKTMARHLMAGRALPDISVSMEEYARRHADVLEALVAAHDRCGVRLLDPLPRLCKEGTCSGTRGNLPLYSDDDHLNADGRQLLVPMFKEIFRESEAH